MFQNTEIVHVHVNVNMLWFKLILSLVQNFSNQFDFYFPLFQIMIMSVRQ